MQYFLRNCIRPVRNSMSAASGSPDLVEALSLPGLSEIDLDVEPARDPPRAAELDQSAEEPPAECRADPASAS